MKKLLIIATYIVLIGILVYHPTPVSNINVDIVTNTITSVLTEYTSTSFTTTTYNTHTDHTTIIFYKYYTTTIDTTYTMFETMTISIYTQTSFTTTLTYYVRFYLEGDKSPNVVYMFFYNPTESYITTTFFGKKVIVSSGDIIQFVNGNTTTAIIPYYNIDVVYLRHIFTIADENYMKLVFENFMQYVSVTELPNDYYSLMDLFNTHYDVLTKFTSPVLPHKAITSETVDQYFVSDIFFVKNAIYSNLVTFFFPESVPGAIIESEGKYYYREKEYGNLPALLLANNLSTTLVIGTFNKYSCFTKLSETKILMPSIMYPGNKYTYYGTTVSGSNTTIVVIVMNGSEGYMQTNSDPVLSIHYNGTYYYIISNGFTEAHVREILPYLFIKTNFYYVDDTHVIATYSDIYMSQQIITFGSYSWTSNTILFEYTIKYKKGIVMQRVYGKIILG